MSIATRTTAITAALTPPIIGPNTLRAETLLRAWPVEVRRAREFREAARIAIPQSLQNAMRATT